MKFTSKFSKILMIRAVSAHDTGIIWDHRTKIKRLLYKAGNLVQEAKGVLSTQEALCLHLSHFLIAEKYPVPTL